ncbi:MAG: hypothetical protein H6R02_1635 [Burkholderiaceae bacterium]|jgi:hypothetical protein|nr:hypothetical protein [Burkholderiaceae bacterium]
MEAPLHRLVVTCSQPGAVFRVTDGRSARVGAGMFRLELDLPPGIYTVSTLLGASINSKTVLLDRSKSVEVEATHRSFGEIAFGVAPHVRSLLTASHFDTSATTIVALRGPFRQAPSRKDRASIQLDGTSVAAVAQDTIEDDPGVIWSWQLFRLALQPGSPGIATAIREVNGAGTSHVIPLYGNRTVWLTYPAPKDAAPERFSVPLPHYIRIRLTAPGDVPDLYLQCLSDQVFTALAGRSTLPLSRPVLDLLFAKDADPLLALATAHVASLTLSGYGLLERLPQDEAPENMAGASEALAHHEPVPPRELKASVSDWLDQCTTDIAGRPDVLALKFLYGLCDYDIELDRPPVLLRSLDALIRAEHIATQRGRRCELRDSVWKTRFQVSDAFAFLQWETDTRKGEQKRLDLLRQSFALSQDLHRSLQELRHATEASKAQAVGTSATPSTDTAEASTDPSPLATPEPLSYSGGLLQRAEQAAAVGRHVALDTLAKVTGSTALRNRATSEFETYLKLNAQALRLPSTALGSLTEQFAKARMKFKK